jgi:hypothetical protein
MKTMMAVYCLLTYQPRGQLESQHQQKPVTSVNQAKLNNNNHATKILRTERDLKYRLCQQLREKTYIIQGGSNMTGTICV